MVPLISSLFCAPPCILISQVAGLIREVEDIQFYNFASDAPTSLEAWEENQAKNLDTASLTMKSLIAEAVSSRV